MHTTMSPAQPIRQTDDIGAPWRTIDLSTPTAVMGPITATLMLNRPPPR